MFGTFHYPTPTKYKRIRDINFSNYQKLKTPIFKILRCNKRVFILAFQNLIGFELSSIRKKKLFLKKLFSIRSLCHNITHIKSIIKIIGFNK